jgi:hypothetical protein
MSPDFNLMPPTSRGIIQIEAIAMTKPKGKTTSTSHAAPVQRSKPVKPKTSQRRGPYKYDVCLSFAGENRGYVSRVAKCLRNRGVAVFYDMDEKAYLWGKNLVEHFGELYEKKARYCVMFISEYYARKLWTIHERRSAQARAFRSKKEYILPAYFDDTRLPGLPHTVADIDVKKHRPLQLAKVIIDKLQLDQPSRNFQLQPSSRPTKPSSIPPQKRATAATKRRSAIK